MTELKFEDLTDSQQEAADHKEGALLVRSGAGSGKTTVLKHRYEKMLDKGVDPSNILLTTFTNNAAHEIEERVEGIDDEEETYIGTIHSLFYDLIKDNKELFGFNEDEKMGVYNQWEQQDITEEILRDELPNPGNIDQDMIESTAKVFAHNFAVVRRELIMPEDIEREIETGGYEMRTQIGSRNYEMINNWERLFPKVFHEYLDLLQERNQIDFTGMEFYAYKIFTEDKEMLEYYRNKFQYIIVDEAQDLSTLEWTLFDQLAREHQNIALIGDSAQCLPPDSTVTTPDGETEIADIAKGDKVLSATANGNHSFHEVTATSEKPESERRINVFQTESGKQFKVTDDHQLFARLPEQDYDTRQSLHYLYLMKDMQDRWRIGETESPYARLNLEQNARAITPIKAFESEEEAKLYESIYSLRYSIPKIPFKRREGQTLSKHKWRDKIYDQVDTDVESLAEDLHIDLDSPVRIKQPSSQGSSETLNVNLRMNTREQSESMAHRLRVETGNEKHWEKLDKIESLNKGNARRGGQRYRKWNQDLGYLEKLADKIKQETGGEVVKKFNPVESRKNCYVVPACNVVEGMLVPVKNGDEVVLEEIVEKNVELRETKVYDLEIDYTNNFATSDVFVHNCIYEWRGSDHRFLNQFVDYYDPKIVTVDSNFRSSSQILKSVNSIVEELGAGVAKKELKSHKGEMEESEGHPKVNVYPHPGLEVEGICERIRELYNDGHEAEEIGVLSRRGRNLYQIEQKLRFDYNIPVYNDRGTDFVERDEVSYVLDFLKAYIKQEDDLIISRTAQEHVRGCGKSKVTKAKEAAQQKNMDLVDYLENLDSSELKGVGKKNAMKMRHFASFVKNLDEFKTPMKEILDSQGKWKNKIMSEVDWDSDRRDNIQQITRQLNDKGGFNRDAVEEFLDELVVEEGDESEGKVFLSTIHGAKGREWKSVFLFEANDNILPSYNSDNIEEEKRLFYVAVSRAKEKCFISYHQNDGGTNRSPSEFLQFLEVPGEVEAVGFD